MCNYCNSAIEFRTKLRCHMLLLLALDASINASSKCACACVTQLGSTWFGLWQSSGFLGVILGCLWPFVRFSHYFVIGAFLNFSFSLRFHCFRALFLKVEIICKFVHFVGPKFDSNTEEQVRKIAFLKSHVFSCLKGVQASFCFP